MSSQVQTQTQTVQVRTQPGDITIEIVKNAHKYKVMDLQEFLEKYRGKELVMYVHESPSCNKSKEFSFRAVVRVQ